MHDFFIDLGFTGVFKGSDSAAGELSYINQPRFTNEEFLAVFRHAFSDWSPDARNIFDEFDSITAKNKSATTREKLCLGTAWPDTGRSCYFDDAGNATLTSTVDESEISCKSCGRRVPFHAVFALSFERKAYCTSQCYLKNAIQRSALENRLMTLLNTDDLLSKDDERLLQQSALLCYYQYLILSPSVFSDSLLFYQLPHEALAKLFKGETAEIKEPKTKSAASWQTTIDGVKQAGINFENLIIFFDYYNKVKSEYTHKIIADVSKNPTTSADSTVIGQLRKNGLQVVEVGNDQVSIFDEKGGIKKLQAKLAALVSKQLQLASDTRSSSLSLFYYDLLQLISKRLRIESLDLMTILTSQDEDQQSYK